MSVAPLSFLLILIALLGCVSPERSSTTPEDRNAAASKASIGVYDSRAIAVAYVGSPGFQRLFQGLLSQRKQAAEEGDTVRIAALESQGQTMQQRLHLQGFSTESVEDILDQVAGALADLLEAEGLAAAVSRWDDPALARHAGAAQVDITGAMVALFEPDAARLRHVEQILRQDPIPRETIEGHDRP